MAKTFIRDIKASSFQSKEVLSFFALRRKDLKTKESDGKPFLSLELGDSTGRIDAVLWNDAEAQSQAMAIGDVVQVKGTVTSYRDSPQIRVEAIRTAAPSEYALEDFLPSSALSPAEREAAIRVEMVTVKEPHLAKLLGSFFDDPEFLKSFLVAPAAKLWHHPYLGGLAEHTAAVCKLARGALANYQLLDRDLLLAGCLLHDVGKVPEYRVGTFIDYSDRGRLLGHIVLGDQLVSERMTRIRDFPAELGMRLHHMVLAHHGEKDRGSPVTPATLEALVLHHCDYLDAHAAAYTRIILREGGGTKRWSDYVNLIDRHLYLPGAGADDGAELKLL